MSNKNNPRSGDQRRTENGPRWEGPETDRNSARSRTKWKRIKNRTQRRTGKTSPKFHNLGRKGKNAPLPEAKLERSKTCCVVDQFCTHPANLQDRDKHPLQSACEHCGEDVCTMCSSIRLYRVLGSENDRKRLCNNCQIDLDGDDRYVMARLRKMAGYPYRVKRPEVEE